MSTRNDPTGIQLTYGINHVHGLNIDTLLAVDNAKPVTSTSLSSTKPIFNTSGIRDAPTKLSPVHNSFKTLVKSQLQNTDDDFNSVLDDLTPDLSFSGEDVACPPRNNPESIQNTCYDPTVQDLIAGCELFVDKDKIIATASGSKGDIIVFNLVRGCNPRRKHHKTSAKFSQSISLQLKSPIKQIKMRYSTDLTLLVGVRTEYSVYLLNVFVAKHRIGRIRKVEFLDSRAISGEKLSDFDICTKADLPLVAVVDVVGNFAVYQLIKSTKLTFYRCEPYPLKFSTFHEPTDLSRFKQIVLNPAKPFFYLVCRSSLHQYNITKNALSCKIIAGAFSLIWDFRTLNDHDPLFILLTSKEFIVVDTTKGFKRLLAWKHFINESDSSWSLQITTLDIKDHENYLCVAHSRIRNFCYVLQLEIIRDDSGFAIPKLVGQPTYFIPHASDPINSLVLLHWTTSNMFVSYNITKDLEISTCLFQLSDSAKCDLFPTDPGSFITPKIENLNPNFDIKVPIDCSSLYLKLIRNTEEYDECDLQYNIDKLLSREYVSTPTPLPLNEMLEIPGGAVGDFNAFHLVFKAQLGKLLGFIQGDAEITSSPNTWIVSKCYKNEPVTEDAAENLCNDLQSFFSGFSRDLTGFLPFLMTSLIHISPTNSLQVLEQHEDEIEKNCSHLPKDIRNLVESFEYDMSLPTKYDEGSENIDISGLNVASSQNLARTRPKSHRKRRLLTTKTFPKTQLSQSSLSQGTVLSSSQQSMEPDINIVSSQKSASQVSSIPASSQISSFGSQPFSLSQGKKKVKKKHKKRKVGFW